MKTGGKAPPMCRANVPVWSVAEDTTSEDDNESTMTNNQPDDVDAWQGAEEAVAGPSVATSPVVLPSPTIVLGLQVLVAVPFVGRTISFTQPMSTQVADLTPIGAMTQLEADWIRLWNARARPRFPGRVMVKHVGGGWFQLHDAPPLRWGLINAEVSLATAISADVVFYYWHESDGAGYYHCLTEYQTAQLFARLCINGGMAFLMNQY